MKELESERLKIRKFRMEDVEQVHFNWANDEKISQHLNFNAHNNLNETRQVVASAIKEFDTQTPVWAIEEKETNEIIGYIRITESSKSSKICEFIWTLGHKWRGKGISAEALKTTLRYLFDEQEYEIIVSKYYSSCKEHEETLLNIGMKKEAVLRNRKINKKTGEFENLIIYSVMKNELRD